MLPSHQLENYLRPNLYKIPTSNSYSYIQPRHLQPTSLSLDLRLVMSLKIDVPDVNYTAGSPVNGTVTLVGDGDVNVQTISIKFVGCSNIFVRYCPELAGGSPTSAPDPYSGEIRFFAYETVITEVPQTLCAPQSWPFEFVFPSKGNILKPKKYATITRLIGDKHCPPPLPIKAYRACPRVSVQLPKRSRHTYQFHQMGNTTFSTPTQAPPK